MSETLQSPPRRPPQPTRPVRVLVVDDSPLVQGIFVKQLSQDNEIEVVGTAPDPYIARDLIVQLDPDVVVMDIQMPRMDGLTFLRKLMRYHPLPVIIVSSFAQEGGDLAIQALAAGAVDVICKTGAKGLKTLCEELSRKVKVASRTRKRRLGATAGRQSPRPSLDACRKLDRMVLIGASTGGTEAIRSLLQALPANGPGIAIVQHMPPEFTPSFAQFLNAHAPMEVKEARDGDILEQGRVLVAPGSHHMILLRADGLCRVHLKMGPLVNRQRPSVDVLFKSGARELGDRCVGVLLTGMGQDGAQGLLELRMAGASTVAQDEESCVIFGMPKEAILLGAAEEVLPLDIIPGALLRLAEGPARRRVG